MDAGYRFLELVNKELMLWRWILKVQNKRRVRFEKEEKREG